MGFRKYITSVFSKSPSSSSTHKYDFKNKLPRSKFYVQSRYEDQKEYLQEQLEEIFEDSSLNSKKKRVTKGLWKLFDRIVAETDRFHSKIESKNMRLREKLQAEDEYIRSQDRKLADTRNNLHEVERKLKEEKKEGSRLKESTTNEENHQLILEKQTVEEKKMMEKIEENKEEINTLLQKIKTTKLENEVAVEELKMEFSRKSQRLFGEFKSTRQKLREREIEVEKLLQLQKDRQLLKYVSRTPTNKKC